MIAAALATIAAFVLLALVSDAVRERPSTLRESAVRLARRGRR